MEQYLIAAKQGNPNSNKQNAPPTLRHNLLPRLHQPLLPALQAMPAIPRAPPDAQDLIAVFAGPHQGPYRAAAAELAETARDDGGVPQREGVEIGGGEK